MPAWAARTLGAAGCGEPVALVLSHGISLLARIHINLFYFDGPQEENLSLKRQMDVTYVRGLNPT